MTERRRLVLHVGYPKTGTSSLQAGLFRGCDNVHFWGKLPGEKVSDPLILEFRDLVNNGHLPAVRAESPRIAAALSRMIRASELSTHLISFEGFANPAVDTHYVQVKDIYRKADDLRFFANELRKGDIDVEILISVRDQVRLVPSFYAQTFFQGFAAGLYGRSYDDFIEFLFRDRYLGFGPMFRFDEVADHYVDLFGEDSVTVVSMKDLFASGSTHGKTRLAAMLDVSEHRVVELLASKKANVKRQGDSNAYTMMTWSPAGASYQEKVGVHLRLAAFGPLNRARLGLGKRVTLTLSDHSQGIRDYYAGSNARLESKYKVSL